MPFSYKLLINGLLFSAWPGGGSASALITLAPNYFEVWRGIVSQRPIYFVCVWAPAVPPGAGVFPHGMIRFLRDPGTLITFSDVLTCVTVAAAAEVRHAVADKICRSLEQLDLQRRRQVVV